MKKYQIVDFFGDTWHAGSKATNDCVEILDSLGFEKCVIRRSSSEKITDRLLRQLKYISNFKEIYNQIEENSVVVLQNPFKTLQFTRTSTFRKLKYKKNVRFISIIHDLNIIRKTNKTFRSEQEFKEMLDISEKFIIHNDKMKEWFINYGVTKERLVNLEIFDYLSSVEDSKKIIYSKKIQIAGNLSPEKSPYIYKLQELNNEFELVGIHYNNSHKYPNVLYKGAFPAEEVPMKLSTGFGLVWDGNSIDTCAGETGKYLRYNNPHKLSLYLVSGLPVIIWDEAAEADFVKENKVGIIISSLRDIDKVLENLTEEEYFKMVRNAKDIQERLKSGYYLKKALEQALLLL